MTTKETDANTDPETHDTMQVIAHSAPDYRIDKVACVFCNSIMKWLSGMPEGHGQWLCQSCGRTAYQGYGDTPTHNIDPRNKLIVSPNDPYPTGPQGLDAGNGLGKALFKDLPQDNTIELELDEAFDELRPTGGRPRTRQLPDRKGIDKNVNRRYGMMHDIQSAEEAAGMI